VEESGKGSAETRAGGEGGSQRNKSLLPAALSQSAEPE